MIISEEKVLKATLDKDDKERITNFIDFLEALIDDIEYNDCDTVSVTDEYGVPAEITLDEIKIMRNNLESIKRMKIIY